MHYFSTDFLVAMAEKLKQQGQYHIAHKKIPSKDGPVQVTDAFANRTHAVLVQQSVTHTAIIVAVCVMLSEDSHQWSCNLVLPFISWYSLCC